MLKHMTKRLPRWVTASSLTLLSLSAITLTMVQLRSEALTTLNRWGFNPSSLGLFPLRKGGLLILTYSFEEKHPDTTISGVVTFDVYSSYNFITTEMKRNAQESPPPESNQNDSPLPDYIREFDTILVSR